MQKKNGSSTRDKVERNIGIAQKKKKVEMYEIPQGGEKR